MRTTITLIALMCANTAFAGNAGGNGGEIYIDELKAYRSWLSETLAKNEESYRSRFNYSKEQFDSALKTIRAIRFIRKDLVPKEVKALLPKPIDELFIIDDEQKAAINIVLSGNPIVFLDPIEWDKLDGKIGRKRALVAHEIYGILGLESTGDIRYSKEFVDDGPAATIITKSGVPVTPLWNDRLFDSFLIDDNERCEEAANKRLPAIIGNLCRPHVPTGEPPPFFSFECAFWGSIGTRWKEGTKTTEYTIRGHVPGVYTAYRTSSYSSYFYADSEIVSHIVRSTSGRYERYHPGYDLFETTKIEVPVYQKFCAVKGSVFLSGIDPLIEDELTPKLLKSSEGSWDELLSGDEMNPEKRMLNLCFSYRKKIRKGLSDASRCKVFPIGEIQRIGKGPERIIGNPIELFAGVTQACMG